MGKKDKKKEKKKGFLKRPYYQKLAIPIDVFQSIRALTLAAEGEISAFGRTEFVENDLSKNGVVVLVKEMEVFKQDCEPLHTSLKGADLTQMYVGVAQKEGRPEKWNFWWHSHVDMSTGFSAEDDSTMKKLTAPREGSSIGGFMVALCTNKFGDYSATVYKSGKRLMDEIPLMIQPDMSNGALEKAHEIIKEKVTFTDPIPHTRGMYIEDEYDFPGFEFEDFYTPPHLKKIKPGYLPIAGMTKNARKKLKRKNEKHFGRPDGWAVRPS